VNRCFDDFPGARTLAVSPQGLNNGCCTHWT
jgi:hypothetical protein